MTAFLVGVIAVLLPALAAAFAVINRKSRAPVVEPIDVEVIEEARGAIHNESSTRETEIAQETKRKLDALITRERAIDIARAPIPGDEGR